MKKFFEEKLFKIAEEKQIKTDPSHDFQHVLRVFNLAKKIGRQEKADPDILIPAALFHDIVVYRKDHSGTVAAFLAAWRRLNRRQSQNKFWLYPVFLRSIKKPCIYWLF